MFLNILRWKKRQLKSPTILLHRNYDTIVWRISFQYFWCTVFLDSVFLCFSTKERTLSRKQTLLNLQDQSMLCACMKMSQKHYFVKLIHTNKREKEEENGESPVSGSPCILQYAVFLFSFLQLSSLQIKSFWLLQKKRRRRKCILKPGTGDSHL
jgi:hypothetical protein